MSQEYSFSLPYAAFDLDLIGLSAVDIDAQEFSEKVSQFFASEFAKCGGKARVVLNDTAKTINVKWTKEDGFKEPKLRALELLQAGKIADAIPLLWALLQQRPSDIDALYNLGVAYSELGQVQKSIAILQRLVEAEPKHVHGLVALGVACIKQGDVTGGEKYLRQALNLEPQNLWALKNLGACLLKQGRANDAIPVFEKALSATPEDPQLIIGTAQAYEGVDRVTDADVLYVKLIALGGPEHILNLAKDRRTAIAQKTMRERGEFRPDVMMYISGALEKFAGMTKNQIQAIGVEIAIRGQRGLDINDPDSRYTLKSLPGDFSGLHLVSIMYAAFQQFAPGENIGLDFSKEYEAAVAMRL